MKVLYSGANTLTLPFTDKVGNKKKITFVPGKNEVHPDDWRDLVTERKVQFENYYSSVLKVFMPSGSMQAQKNEEKFEIPIGSESTDYQSLDLPSAKELIENTMDPDELKGYLELEHARKNPRKGMIKMIEGKIEQINLIDKDRESNRQ